MTDGIARTIVAVHLAVLIALVAGGYTAGLTYDEIVSNPWSLPFLVINLGVLGGNAVMMALAKAPSTARSVAWEGRRADLLDSRALVVEQLKNLEAERDKLDPQDYARERSALLSVGAAASRELDEDMPTAAEATAVHPATVVGTGAFPVTHDLTSPATSPPHLGPADAMLVRLRAEREANPDAFDDALGRLGIRTGGSSGEMRGVAYTMAVLGLVALLGYLASESSRTRAPGTTMTGGDSVAGDRAAPAADDPASALQARLAADPEDLDALNRLTELSIVRQDFRTALELNQRAEAVAPDDADVRTYKAVMQAFIGRRPDAIATLREVVTDHPAHLNALFYLGVFLSREAPEEAVGILERALAVEDLPQIRAQLAELRQRLGSGAPGPATPAAPQAAAASALIGGRVEVPAGATGQVLFVTVRPSGSQGGPPYAALRLPPGPFPMDFAIAPGDVMPMWRNAPTPDAFDVSARLDADGNASTRPEVDPSVVLPGIAQGTDDVILRLE